MMVILLLFCLAKESHRQLSDLKVTRVQTCDAFVISYSRFLLYIKKTKATFISKIKFFFCEVFLDKELTYEMDEDGFSAGVFWLSLHAWEWCWWWFLLLNIIIYMQLSYCSILKCILVCSFFFYLCSKLY